MLLSYNSDYIKLVHFKHATTTTSKDCVAVGGTLVVQKRQLVQINKHFCLWESVVCIKVIICLFFPVPFHRVKIVKISFKSRQFFIQLRKELVSRFSLYKQNRIFLKRCLFNSYKACMLLIVYSNHTTL